MQVRNLRVPCSRRKDLFFFFDGSGLYHIPRVSTRPLEGPNVPRISGSSLTHVENREVRLYVHFAIEGRLICPSPFFQKDEIHITFGDRSREAISIRSLAWFSTRPSDIHSILTPKSSWFFFFRNAIPELPDLVLSSWISIQLRQGLRQYGYLGRIRN